MSFDEQTQTFDSHLNYLLQFLYLDWLQLKLWKINIIKYYKITKDHLTIIFRSENKYGIEKYFLFILLAQMYIHRGDLRTNTVRNGNKKGMNF